jgi:hypothetical protein
MAPRYALEQFFHWAAGRAISRESVQGYVTWLGEMKFSPSTINQRLAAIRKLATEAQRCGYVDSETAQAIVSVPPSYLSFCESGVSYSVTTVTLATAFAAGFSSLVATT